MGESLFAALEARDNGEAGQPKGNRRRGLFPRLLQGYYERIMPEIYRDSGAVKFPVNAQLLSSGFDPLVEFLERGFALDLLAIDEKGRRRIDLQHLGGVFLVGDDLVEQRLVLQAGLDRPAG